MTDRVKALVVVLESDFRLDDAEPLIRAIETMRGVAGVEVNRVNVDDYANRKRLRIEYFNKLHEALGEVLNEQ